MGFFTLTPKKRLIATIAISFSFFVAEIVGMHTYTPSCTPVFLTSY